jgi:pyruvate dehydrogenase E2 component (dihydrolipoamide acetyltransferase)
MKVTRLSPFSGEERAVVRDGEIVVRTVMSCTLSVDHRVVDGAVGARNISSPCSTRQA